MSKLFFFFTKMLPNKFSIEIFEGSGRTINLTQCDQIWKKIATLVNLKVFGNIFEAWFTICLHFKPILAIFMIGIGQIIITVVISQILKNDLDIWSH